MNFLAKRQIMLPYPTASSRGTRIIDGLCYYYRIIESNHQSRPHGRFGFQPLGNYLPLKTGERFIMKAETASARSSLAKKAEFQTETYSSPSATE